jgi:hypothetical protein
MGRAASSEPPALCPPFNIYQRGYTRAAVCAILVLREMRVLPDELITAILCLLKQTCIERHSLTYDLKQHYRSGSATVSIRFVIACRVWWCRNDIIWLRDRHFDPVGAFLTRQQLPVLHCLSDAKTDHRLATTRINVDIECVNERHQRLLPDDTQAYEISPAILQPVCQIISGISAYHAR